MNCKTCKYWKRKNGTLVGTCNLIVSFVTDDVHLRIYHHPVNFLFDKSEVLIGEGFGCIHHRIKE